MTQPASDDPLTAASGSRRGLTPLRALGLLFLWALITLGGNQLLLPRDVPPMEVVTRHVAWGIFFACVFLAVLMWRRGWLAAFRAPPARSLLLLWVPSLYILFFVVGMLACEPPAPSFVLYVAINTLLVGFSEEVMFRGLLFPALRSRIRIWPAIWLTSAIFGVAHVANVLATGALTMAMAQAVAATMSGLVFMAILLRTGSLWPCILFHAAWDFSLFLLQGSAAEMGTQPDPTEIAPVYFLAPILFILPNALYALWLMRRAGKERLPGDVPGP